MVFFFKKISNRSISIKYSRIVSIKSLFQFFREQKSFFSFVNCVQKLFITFVHRAKRANVQSFICFVYIKNIIYISLIYLNGRQNYSHYLHRNCSHYDLRNNMQFLNFEPNWSKKVHGKRDATRRHAIFLKNNTQKVQYITTL